MRPLVLHLTYEAAAPHVLLLLWDASATLFGTVP